jgi:hypothetical protein
MRRTVIAVVFAVVCAGLFAALSARPAHAEPPGLTIATPTTAAPWSTIPVEATIEEPTTTRVSYRWQMVVADLSGLGVSIAAAKLTDDGDQAVGLAGGTYLFGAPLVHASNGHGWRAIGSLAVRAALPAIGLAIAMQSRTKTGCDNCLDDNPPIAEAMLGLGAGALAALVIDYGLIARPTQRRWLPTAAPANHGGTVGLSATF